MHLKIVSLPVPAMCKGQLYWKCQFYKNFPLGKSVEVHLWHDVLADGLTVNDAVSTTSDEMTTALRHVLQCLTCFCKCTHLQGASQNCKPSL